jgi:2-desacetyl-2-hydroxyethyl bacteriochlorophyllide A dehydrogenase
LREEPEASDERLREEPEASDERLREEPEAQLMRAAVLREGRMVLRDNVPEPVAGPGQVLVEVKACGICGSDLHFAKHGAEMLALTREMKGMPIEGGLPIELSDDVFMGHEFSAEVLETGPGTDAPPTGTLVTSIPVLVSAEGIEPILYSNGTVGGYAERMLLSAPLLLTVPNGLDARRAALAEPMAVGLHAVNLSSVERGEATMVLGCGPIGLAIIAALRRRGVETIVAADYSSKRRQLAEAMGASEVLDPAQGSAFDHTTPAVIFEAVGVPGILDDVFRRAPIGSRVVVAGVCMQADSVHPFFAAAKQLSIRFAMAYEPTEFAESLRAIAEGEIDVAPMVTGEVGLDGVGAAFDDLSDPDRHCKILVTP